MRGIQALAFAAVVGAFSVTLVPVESAFAGGCSQHPGNEGTICCQPIGADVIVGSIQSHTNYSADIGYDAFSFGTTSCNIGDENLDWISSNNRHPVIGQNLYKLKNGRFEQIGLSWLKHGFFALSQNSCGCGCSGTNGTALGVGCSDPYTASRNGSQSNLGPRWQVNAHNGVFTYPPSGGTGYSGSNTIRRLRVALTDLEPSSGSVQYFVECQYVTQDDAQNGNGNNNASYRPVIITGNALEYSCAVTGTTQREQAGVRAWKDADPTVTETDIQVCNEGLFILAAKATDLGGGMWHYEYALENLNSDRSGGSFSVPIPEGTTVSNVGFHDVEYHGGDGINNITVSGNDWVSAADKQDLKWSVSQSYDLNPNSNALRWGTTYNFRFDSDAPPTTGDATITLFKPGTPRSVTGSTVVPGPQPEDCVGDIAPSGGNGMVNVDDLLGVINAWGPCPAACAVDCNADIAPKGGDGTVGIDDLLGVINNWGGCPK